MDGQNTQNISLAINLLTTLISNAAPLAAAIQAAQAAGTDITDAQLNDFTAAYQAAQQKFQDDIDAMPNDPPAGTTTTPPATT